MLDEKTLEWLERRKIGMCCRCENYADCQWIPQPRGHFQTAQCWRFKSADGYCIDKSDYMDAAEFEKRVAAKLTELWMLTELWILSGGKPQCQHNVCIAPMLHQQLSSCDAEKICAWCILKDARLAVEREMIAEERGREISTTDEKKQLLAELLSEVCRREEKPYCCPVGDYNCPFPEKICLDVTPEDWRGWMEKDK